jgi:hypothetical protein
MAAPSRLVPGLVTAALLMACREGSESQVGDFVPILPADAGTQGCGPTAVAPGTVTSVFTDPALGPLSQLAASADAETLYWTGSDGSIHELAFPGGGGAPVDSVLVAPGVIDATYLAPGLGPSQLSGIAVVDAQFLVAAEHASNTLVAVRRDVPDTVIGLAGFQSASGGFADGLGGDIRFHFTAPVPLLADATGSVLVGDTENHALRRVTLGGIPQAVTLAGSGAPGDEAGALNQVRFDTPSGLAATCDGRLLLVESGAAGVGGHRLLALSIGAAAFFGGFDGAALPVAGDGTEETLGGIDTASHLAAPQGLVSTQDGLSFWIDSTDGILRRHDVTTGVSDCPLFADCAAAVTAGGSFTGASFALALGASGALYVLEADTGTLFRVDP